MKNWKKVYEVESPIQAEIMIGVLTENNLNPVLINKKDSAYLFGICEIYVQNEEVIRALQILKTKTDAA